MVEGESSAKWTPFFFLLSSKPELSYPLKEGRIVFPSILFSPFFFSLFPGQGPIKRDTAVDVEGGRLMKRKQGKKCDISPSLLFFPPRVWIQAMLGFSLFFPPPFLIRPGHKEG